jgi:hypothetical protein
VCGAQVRPRPGRQDRRKREDSRKAGGAPGLPGAGRFFTELKARPPIEISHRQGFAPVKSEGAKARWRLPFLRIIHPFAVTNFFPE